jgi:hypothetical protein
MFYLLSIYLAPLAPLPIAIWIHGRKWKSIRIVLYFSAVYILILCLGLYYVWYSYTRGYQDWIMANIVPQGTAILSIPISWVAFFATLRDRNSSDLQS